MSEHDGEQRRVILVTRQTRLSELVEKHLTLGQAKFYLEHLGASFDDYLEEDYAYKESLQLCTKAIQAWGRYQVLDRQYLPNFVFAQDDIVVAIGQDGLVANSLKYLHGQPLIGINPDPQRWDGLLLPFESAQLASKLSSVARQTHKTRDVTMAEARLSDGQTLLGVNDIFIGAQTHTSALYDLDWNGKLERQSSSGLIVSTGLGSTAWMKSVVTGSRGIAQIVSGGTSSNTDPIPEWKPVPWNAEYLLFAVREPFISQQSQAETFFGEINESKRLTLRSRMPDNGVIFSDGIEQDFLRFTAGMEVSIGLGERKGTLVC